LRKKIIALLLMIIFLATAGAVYLSLPRDGFPGTKMIVNHPQLAASAANGRPTMIYFSTVDCPACIMEDMVLEDLIPFYNGTHNFVLLKFDQNLSGVFQDWSVIKVPTLIFADRSGTIKERLDGQYLAEDALREKLERLG
jgi:thiol-disulfide isomerase/thioredoxin